MVHVLCLCFLLAGEVESLLTKKQIEKRTEVAHLENYDVALMLVGRTFRHRSIKHGKIADRDLTINDLTGEEEEGEYDTELRETFKEDVWSNQIKMLIAPLNATVAEIGGTPMKKHQSVDVYLCIDAQLSSTPPEVSQVFVVHAKSQDQRGAACLSKVRSNGRSYSWFIAVRPDFVFYKPFPDMASFNPGYVYTRLRKAQGIGGLTSDHFSFNVCTPSCNGDPLGAIGYVNDDMIRVVPWALIDFAFNVDGVPSSNRSLQFPTTWVTLYDNVMQEGRLTKFWVDHGVLTMPLACPGYPHHDRFNHRHLSKPCSRTPVIKLACGANATFESVHKSLA